MTVSRNQHADDPKKGMTFGELRSFVQESLRYSISDEATLRIKIGWKSQIQSMEVTDETGPNEEPLL